MAEHKVVNTTQLEADLTSIADAIRAKVESSDSFVFPSGFVDAIANLETGGGLPSNISALSAGTIVTTNSPTTITIEHGLGVRPNFYIVRDQDEVPNSSNNLIVQIVESAFNTQGVSMVSYTTTSSISSKGSSTANVGYILGANATSFKTKDWGTSYFFKAGHTYHWICGVIETQ